MLTFGLSETTSIPTNPRTTRPVGYAFVDVSTAEEAQKAITELAGKFILERKVSVQLARKPETAAASGAEGSGEGEGGRRRNSTRGRGRGRARGGRANRGGRNVRIPHTFPTSEVVQADRTFLSVRPKPAKIPMSQAKRNHLPMLQTQRQTKLQLTETRSLVLLVNPVSVDLPKTVFLPKIRLWLPISHTILARRR